MTLAGHIASMGERRGAYRVSVGRPRHRWKDIIKTSSRCGMVRHGMD